MTASGTFGSGAEYSEFVDLNRLGAVVTKGVANVPWPGNPTPRVTETSSPECSMPSVFRIRELMFSVKEIFRSLRNMIQRSSSMSVENLQKDYCEVVERLGNEPVDMLEINVSCPNVKEGGIAFGQNPKALGEPLQKK